MKNIIKFFSKEEKQKRALNSINEIIAEYYHTKKCFLKQQKQMLKKGYSKAYILEQYAPQPIVKIATAKEKIFYPEQFAFVLSHLFNVNISADTVYYGKIFSADENCTTLIGEKLNYCSGENFPHINCLLCFHEKKLYGVELNGSLRNIIFIDAEEVLQQTPPEFRILVKEPGFMDCQYHHYFLCYEINTPIQIVRTYKFGSEHEKDMMVISWEQAPTADRMEKIIETF